jgi:hypothetical protein
MNGRGKCALLVLALTSRVAAGEPASTAKAETSAAADVRATEARALFLEGRRLIETGRHREAIPILLRSQELVPTVGTLLNLGLCHRMSGQASQALVYYRQARTAAEAAGDAERAAVANTEIAALESVAARLSIRISDASDVDLRISVDGTARPRESWQDALWVDPGVHTITAESRGRIAWHEKIATEPGARYVVSVPQLLPERGPAASPSPTPSPSRPGIAQRTTAVVLGVTGAAGFIVAGILAASARSTFDSTSTECTVNDVCTPDGVAAREAAVSRANAATVVTIVSAGVLSTGALLWFTAPSARSAPRDTGPRIGFGAGTIALSGRF